MIWNCVAVALVSHDPVSHDSLDLVDHNLIAKNDCSVDITSPILANERVHQTKPIVPRGLTSPMMRLLNVWNIRPNWP